MRSLLVAALLMAVSLTLSAGETEGPFEEGVPSPDARDLIENGLAIPGSKIHHWMKAHLRGVMSDTPVQYAFHVKSTGAAPVSLVELLSAVELGLKNQIELQDDPGEPSGIPNGIPSTATTGDSCGRLRIGTSYAVGSVTFTWTYQNTRDSNGDGKKDADPKWVLTGFSVSNIQYLTEGGPIPC